ncbi:MAG: ribosome maturation factor RimM [Lachnospiraceae bacterium]|nr:ribosome maturation factor RimM [Lachnospiraceae bacterium]
MDELLQVGVITSTHGIKGEVKVFPTTDDVNRFKQLKEVILDTGKEQMTLQIEGVKFFKQFVILKFKGIDDINDIERYSKRSLYVTRENAVPLGENEYFIADLIDLTVIDEAEKEFGVLKDVIQTGANDVYVITMTDEREVLVPAIKECILDVNLEKRVMKIHLLEGLLD